MNYLGVHIAPDLVEESWREVERELELRRVIRERRDEQRAARRAARSLRVAAFVARARQVTRARRPRPVAQGCS